jgi:phage terminase large subunit-like protein
MESKHQHRPKVRGGNIINRAWFKEPLLDFPRGGKIIRFWDLASTEKEERRRNNPDFTAGALLTYYQGMVYIIDIVATQIATKAKYDLIKQTAVMDDAMYGSVMQIWEEEGGAGGKDVTVTLNELLDAHLRAPFRVRIKKGFYVELFANKAETGNVRVIKGAWLHRKRDNNTFFDSAEAFPSKLVHDDDIDAVSKGCFLLTGGVINESTGELETEEEHKPIPHDPELEKQTLFQILEKQLLTKRKIDDKVIKNFEETLAVLDQIANKYVDKGDDKMADVVYDEVDRVEELQKKMTKVLPHYFDLDKAPESDIMLNMAKGQGYVPQGCLLGGTMVMLIINGGGDPCKGCECLRFKCGGRNIE